jgi:hypothetical protein
MPEQIRVDMHIEVSDFLSDFSAPVYTLALPWLELVASPTAHTGCGLDWVTRENDLGAPSG